MGFFGKLKSLFSRGKPTPKLGLALGSGGAKGMAHLGALKAFEEAGLRFQIVTGTSIGAIAGALYAKGFSSSDMVEIIRTLNVKEFSRNLRPFADTKFVEDFLESYLEGDITDLSLPFATWATDADTNEGVLLDSGRTARAATASAAIPPFFRAVEIDGRRLVDGAFSNAIPADVCKNMGADFVVGCDLSAYATPPEERNGISRLIGSAISAFTPVRYLDDSKTRGYEACDFMLRPDLKGFRATDVSRAAMDEMFERGYQEASSRMDELKDAIAKSGYARR
ncbi:MAG: patatin-like phospholipase family protein [Candidatus Gallimonas sp.]